MPGELFVGHDAPDHTRTESSPEFTAAGVPQWLGRTGVKTLSIEPGSRWENGDVESFDGKRREERSNREVFESLLEAQVSIERRRHGHNTFRPHSSSDYRRPAPEARMVIPNLRKIA